MDIGGADIDPHDGETRPERSGRARDERDEPGRARRFEPPFHYATQTVTTLEHVAERLPATARVRLTARGRRISVVSVRLTGRGGGTIHARPTATAEALYLDYRDLAALEAGAAVPELDVALDTMLGEV